MKFEQRIYVYKEREIFCFVDAFKPHNHINILGSNVDGFLIIQHMDIRWSTWYIYIDIIIPIWFIESSENTTTLFECGRLMSYFCF